MFNLIEVTLVKTWNKMKNSNNELSRLAYGFVNGGLTPNKINCSPFKVKDINSEIESISKKREGRKNKNIPTVYQWWESILRKKYTEKLRSFAKEAPSMRYSMGDKMEFRLFRLDVSAAWDTRKEYSKSCNYNAIHGVYCFGIKLSEIDHYSVIGGLITYIYPNQRSKVKRCFWLESKGQKNHYQIIKVEGFIYEGYHSLNKDTTLHGGMINLQQKKEVETSQKAFNKASRLQYSYQDAIDAGNCEAGTLNFCRVFDLDKKRKYRGDYLIRITQKSNYEENIRRMISKKVK